MLEDEYVGPVTSTLKCHKPPVSPPSPDRRLRRLPTRRPWGGTGQPPSPSTASAVAHPPAVCSNTCTVPTTASRTVVRLPVQHLREAPTATTVASATWRPRSSVSWRHRQQPFHHAGSRRWWERCSLRRHHHQAAKRGASASSRASRAAPPSHRLPTQHRDPNSPSGGGGGGGGGGGAAAACGGGVCSRLSVRPPQQQAPAPADGEPRVRRQACAFRRLNAGPHSPLVPAWRRRRPRPRPHPSAYPSQPVVVAAGEWLPSTGRMLPARW